MFNLSLYNDLEVRIVGVGYSELPSGADHLIITCIEGREYYSYSSYIYKYPFKVYYTGILLLHIKIYFYLLIIRRELNRSIKLDLLVKLKNRIN